MPRKDPLAFINRMAAELGIFPVSVQPRMRYFRVKGDHYAFCWTTQRDIHLKFYALKYRIVKAGKTWKLVHQVAFARRKTAKARARKWFEERKMLLACQPLHPRSCGCEGCIGFGDRN